MQALLDRFDPARLFLYRDGVSDHTSSFAVVPAPVVGLTGGIASGKSTVARMFQGLGIPHVDADAVARTVVRPGTVGLAKVLSEFGHVYQDSHGGLDRKKLGELVFTNNDAKARLEEILHPLIRTESIAVLRNAVTADTPYALYEAALLVETGAHADCAALILVATSSEAQIERLMKRNQLDHEAAEARVASQASLATKKAAADFVVDNGGSLDATQAQVGAIDQSLRTHFKDTAAAGTDL